MHVTLPLRDEHRVILRVLECMEIALDRVAATGLVAVGRFGPFLGFLRDFSDGCHHRKEEERLFVILERMGIEVSGGPLAQLEVEHEIARSLTRTLATILAAAEDGVASAVAVVLATGRELIDLLRKHIDKEEHCFFGMAEELIRGEELEQLLASYRETDEDQEYRVCYDRCLKLADRLAAEFGLAPVQLSSPVTDDDPIATGPNRMGESGSTDWQGTTPYWQAYMKLIVPDTGTELANRVDRVLASPAVGILRDTLAGVGGRIDAAPLLWKMLPGGFLRLFFPVTREPDYIEAGSVVAIVLLYDVTNDRTLYAHPVYAGPEANPLLKHVGGPMAQPRSQTGENGVSATRRLLHHKAAIWDCFERERVSLGWGEASRRWRDRYAWSLVRLYFCERCPACRWGSPHFDGASGPTFRARGGAKREIPTMRLRNWEKIAPSIRMSKAWAVEVAYAERGAFQICEVPRLVVRLAGDWVVAIFPTDAEFLDGGSIVAAAAYFHEQTNETRYVQCLAAGAEAEVPFVLGDRSLGLPLPSGPHGASTRVEYEKWRRRAWSQFWLNELELGLHAASARWLADYWEALRMLFTTPNHPGHTKRSPHRGKRQREGQFANGQAGDL